MQFMTYTGARYGLQTDFLIALEMMGGGNNYTITTNIAAADCRISKDGGAVTNCTNAPSLVTASQPIIKHTLTAAEMSAHRILIVYRADGGGNTLGSALLIENNPVPLALLRGTSSAGAASTITLPATGADNQTTSTADDFYNEATITLIGGTGVGQQRVIADYVGSTKVATVNRAWVVNPDATSVFIISNGADVWDQYHGAEPAAAALTLGTPTHTFRKFMQYMVAHLFHAVTVTNSTQKVKKSDSSTDLTTMSLSNDGTTITKGVSS